MQFVLQTPSLQHLAGVKIVAHLWSQRDIFTQIKQIFTLDPFYSLEQEMNEWKAIEEKVKSNVWAFQLPILCEKQLRRLIQPLGIELLTWCNRYCVGEEKEHFLDTMLPHQLCWTMHGSLDYRRTADLLMKDERVDVESRFELACINCLEDEARVLFESMSEEQRQTYVTGEKVMTSTFHRLQVFHFTSILTGDMAVINNFLQSLYTGDDTLNVILFEHALWEGDAATCEYWYDRLSEGEKREVLEDRQMGFGCFVDPRASSWLYYLSLMNEGQWEGLLREYTYYFLTSFLGWPMQSVFVEVVKRVNEEVFSRVLLDIADRISSPYHDSQLFLEFWRFSPNDYKRNFLNNIYHLDCLSLCHNKDEKVLRLVFDEAPRHLLKQLMDQWESNRNEPHIDA